jgi:hypothetical protein
MNYYFNMYLEKASIPIKVASIVGAISGNIAGSVIRSNYCSDNSSLDFCKNSDYQIASAAAGTLAGIAAGVVLGSIYPALKTFVGWSYYISSQVHPVELELEGQDNNHGLNV